MKHLNRPRLEYSYTLRRANSCQIFIARRLPMLYTGTSFLTIEVGTGITRSARGRMHSTCIKELPRRLWVRTRPSLSSV